MIPPKIKKLPGLRKQEPGYISKQKQSDTPNKNLLYNREKMVR